jgi:hypothetical protein
MPPADGSEPIDDSELLYRRVPVSQGLIDSQGVSPAAFRPHRNDTTGLSVYRAKYKSIAEAARGQSASGYFVLAFTAGNARALGIDIAPNPLPGDPGHAEIPSLTYDVRKTDVALEHQHILARKVPLTVHGPFTPHS